MELRTAVVTGAGGGIGSAVTHRLLQYGYRVIGLNRTAPNLDVDDSVRERWRPGTADVREQASIEAALSDVGPIHAVVANAGMCQRNPLDAEDTDAVWKAVLDVNLTGVWNTFRAVRHRLTEGGAAVMVSSGLGKLGRPGYSAYTASKHGVLGLVKCLSPELAPRGIRVNAVCPGWVDTAMARADLGVTSQELGISVDAARKDAESGIPLGRFVHPKEVAALICWLLSEDAGAITGQSYNIACGEFTV